MKSYLAIFDMDGTLFDTCKANYKAYSSAIDKCGILSTISEEKFTKECFGKNYMDFLPSIYGVFDQEILKRIHDFKTEHYQDFCNQYVTKNEHLFNIIENIRDKYYVVIVTTAARENVNTILSKFKAQDLFDLIISQEDVKKLKPNPEGYLLAMKYYSIPENRTIVFEDSDACIASAKELGCSVVKIEKI